MTEKKDITKLPLDIELLQAGDYLFGRINNQDEALRMNPTFTHKGVKIAGGGGGGGPALYRENSASTTLYIRGTNKAADYVTIMAKYVTEREASEWAQKLVDAITEFNKKPTNVPTPPTEPLRCKRILG